MQAAETCQSRGAVAPPPVSPFNPRSATYQRMSLYLSSQAYVACAREQNRDPFGGKSWSSTTRRPFSPRPCAVLSIFHNKGTIRHSSSRLAREHLSESHSPLPAPLHDQASIRRSRRGIRFGRRRLIAQKTLDHSPAANGKPSGTAVAWRNGLAFPPSTLSFLMHLGEL